MRPLETSWRSYGTCPGCSHLVATRWDALPAKRGPIVCAVCARSSHHEDLVWLDVADFHYKKPRRTRCRTCGAGLVERAESCAMCGVPRDAQEGGPPKAFPARACPRCEARVSADALGCPACDLSMGPNIPRLYEEDHGAFVIACPYCEGFLGEVAKADNAITPPSICPYCHGDPRRDACHEIAWDAFFHHLSTKRCAACDAEIRAGALVCGACRRGTGERAAPAPPRAPSGPAPSRRARRPSARRWRAGLVALGLGIPIALGVYGLRERAAEEDAVAATVLERVGYAEHLLRVDDPDSALPADVVTDGPAANTLVFGQRSDVCQAALIRIGAASWVEDEGPLCACKLAVRDNAASRTDRMGRMAPCRRATYLLRSSFIGNQGLRDRAGYEHFVGELVLIDVRQAPRIVARRTFERYFPVGCARDACRALYGDALREELTNWPRR